MQRCRAILVIIALLGAPWTLVARAFAAEPSECNGYCCLPHGPQSHHLPHSSTNIASEGIQCQHGEIGHLLDCSMKSSHHSLDFSLLSPLAPTTLSVYQRIAAPKSARRPQTARTIVPVAGFRAAPFEPPRS